MESLPAVSPLLHLVVPSTPKPAWLFSLCVVTLVSSFDGCQVEIPSPNIDGMNCMQEKKYGFDGHGSTCSLSNAGIHRRLGWAPSHFLVYSLCSTQEVVWEVALNSPASKEGRRSKCITTLVTSLFGLLPQPFVPGNGCINIVVEQTCSQGTVECRKQANPFLVVIDVVVLPESLEGPTYV